jgi:hypothetical protein
MQATYFEGDRSADAEEIVARAAETGALRVLETLVPRRY